LCHHGAYQQATVQTTADRKFGVQRLLIGHQVFTGSNKIIKHFLLFQLDTGVVPIFTIFSVLFICRKSYRFIMQGFLHFVAVLNFLYHGKSEILQENISEANESRSLLTSNYYLYKTVELLIVNALKAIYERIRPHV
jgi:hypothetical protein